MVRMQGSMQFAENAIEFDVAVRRGRRSRCVLECCNEVRHRAGFAPCGLSSQRVWRRAEASGGGATLGLRLSKRIAGERLGSHPIRDLRREWPPSRRAGGQQRGQQRVQQRVQQRGEIAEGTDSGEAASCPGNPENVPRAPPVAARHRKRRRRVGRPRRGGLATRSQGELRPGEDAHPGRRWPFGGRSGGPSFLGCVRSP